MLLENFGLLFFNILFSIVNSLIAIFISPFVSLINNLFITFNAAYSSVLINVLSSFTTLINTVIFPNAVWVINLFPPVTFSVCMLFVGLWFLILSYELSIYFIIRILTFFKKVVPFV